MASASTTTVELSIEDPELVDIRPEEVEDVFGPPSSPSREELIKTKRRLLAADDGALGGKWDVPSARRFVELEVYEALQARITEGTPWQETGFYERVLRDFERGRTKWGCRTEDEFIKRCESIDALARSIEAEGYKTQRELGTDRPGDEVRVGIRRNGRLLFIDGRHRLAIARILGIPQIPAKIVVRHAKWSLFKDDIIDYAREHRGRVYQAIDHPDLAHIPAGHHTDRVEIITRALEDQAGKGLSLLDIGTHWGYMCQQLERLGFECTGVERNKQSARFARRLRNASGATFEVWHGNVFDYPDAEQHRVVLALNIFHHFIKREEDHEALERFLQRLTADVMIFEPHRHDPPAQMAGAFRNYAPDEFVDFVSQHAGFTHADPIGEARDGRPLYRLSR